jgi:hypothetical protein
LPAAPIGDHCQHDDRCPQILALSEKFMFAKIMEFFALQIYMGYPNFLGLFILE